MHYCPLLCIWVSGYFKLKNSKKGKTYTETNQTQGPSCFASSSTTKAFSQAGSVRVKGSPDIPSHNSIAVSNTQHVANTIKLLAALKCLLVHVVNRVLPRVILSSSPHLAEEPSPQQHQLSSVRVPDPADELVGEASFSATPCPRHIGQLFRPVVNHCTHVSMSRKQRYSMNALPRQYIRDEICVGILQVAAPLPLPHTHKDIPDNVPQLPL